MWKTWIGIAVVSTLGIVTLGCGSDESLSTACTDWCTAVYGCAGHTGTVTECATNKCVTPLSAASSQCQSDFIAESECEKSLPCSDPLFTSGQSASCDMERTAVANDCPAFGP